MIRQSWDETWLAVAQTVAKRSLCSRAQVGAVITDTRNRIVATGYNGPPAHYPTLVSVAAQAGVEPVIEKKTCEHWCPRAQTQTITLTSIDGTPVPLSASDYTDCPSLHAELNALLAADRSTWQGGTIYVTGVICHACGKAIANSGLARVVIAGEDADRSYRVDGHDLLRRCGLTVDEM